MRYILAVVIPAVLISAVCFGQNNPITNGGFEEVDETGAPVDWATLGNWEFTENAHSGDQAIALIRESEEGLCGLNRRWEAHSGEQGTMLSQLKGGVTFWYKAEAATPSDSLLFFVVPMSADAWEDTGAPRARFQIPSHHVGDGEWHKGILAYDFTDEADVKWVHIAPRIRGSEGRMLLDDIKWVERVGPVPTFKKVEFSEIVGREGRAGRLRAILTNDGDRLVVSGTASLQLPKRLAARGKAPRQITSLQPGAFDEVEWTIVGRRARAGAIKAVFRAAGHTAYSTVSYCAELKPIGLFPDRFIIPPDSTTKVTLRLRNDGHAMARNVTAALRAGKDISTEVESRKQSLRFVPPGKEADITWQVKAVREAKRARMKAVVKAENADGGEAASSLIITENAVVADSREDEGEGEEEPFEPRPGAVAKVGEDGAVIHNKKVRLLYPKTGFGYGVGILQRAVEEEDGWQTVAKLPRLTRIVVPTGTFSEAEHLIYAQSARQADSPRAVGPEMLPGKLELTAEFTDANGVNWTVTQAAHLERGADGIHLRLQAQPDEEAKVLAVDGPIVYAGEGARRNTKRLDAIFPGLEWLVEGERSSGSLDIAGDHPDRIRYVPHPHKVTVPMMCARIKAPGRPATVVSMSWDHLAPYYGDLNRPSAVFASPDRFSGRSSTTMGLFAPSMPKFMEANDRAADTPLDVAANEPVTLGAQVTALAAQKDDTALIAVKKWAQQNGVPSPNPLPHGKSYTDEIEFSMAGYLDSLWVAEEGGWLGSIGGPHGNEPTVSPAYLYDLRMCMKTCDAGPIREAVAGRYQKVTEATDRSPVANDMGFQFDSPADRIRSETNRIDGLLERQSRDGSWRFNARIATSGVFEGKDYSELGPDNAAEVGTCAQNAFTVLRYARMTGDEKARGAGLKALKFMDRFRVPRAAQVWEVPVHTPDLLASAKACEAYLEGYRITGREQHLDKAVYWAWTGLPFIYTWDVEGFEFLKYASIPVFGATWYRGSWFGRPVQWNGMEYAYSLLRLAGFDDTFNWEKMARGITISCMYQQSTEEEDRALWPDSISAIDKSKSGWIFAPRRILNNVYKLMGMQPTPVTEICAADGGNIHINAAGSIEGGELADGQLSCKVIYKPPQTGHVLICNITEPGAVTVNGEAVEQVASYTDADMPWWRYLGSAKAVELHTAGTGAHDIQLSDVEYADGGFRPPTVKKLAFEFDKGAEYWYPAHDLTMLRSKDGILHTTTTGADPYMVRNNCQIPAEKVSTLHIRMALEEHLSGNARVFWTTESDPEFDEAKALAFKTVANGDFYEAVVPIGDHEKWSGTITGLRLDPTAGAGTGKVRLDFIRGQ